MDKRLDVIYENGVFRPLEPVELEEHQRATVSIPDVNGKPQAISCYELAKKARLLGIVDSLPEDLSTNRDYFKDFGRDE